MQTASCRNAPSSLWLLVCEHRVGLRAIWIDSEEELELVLIDPGSFRNPDFYSSRSDLDPGLDAQHSMIYPL